MGDLEERARRALSALRVLRDRSRVALEALEGGDYERGSAFLKLKTVAFHNFRALDAMAKDAGLDLSRMDDAKKLWLDIRALDAELSHRLGFVREGLKAEAAKVAEARLVLGRYRSEEVRKSGFASTA